MRPRRVVLDAPVDQRVALVERDLRPVEPATGHILRLAPQHEQEVIISRTTVIDHLLQALGRGPLPHQLDRPGTRLGKLGSKAVH